MSYKIKILENINKIHMVGIKGTGMASLAVNLKNMGLKVSGSDSAEKFFTDELLRAHKIKVLSPFSAGNISEKIDLVITSTAYNNTNPELKEAVKRGLNLMTYSEVIGLLSRELKSVAVCGSHGKTTVSALLSYILSRSSSGVLPNVGSIVPQLVYYKTPAPDVFVFEADEYQNKFRYFHPNMVILTNVDYDHPDFFKTKKEYTRAFADFIKRIPSKGLLIYCGDDRGAVETAKHAKCKKIKYNLSTSQVDRWPSGLFGKHNIFNTAAAVTCAGYLGVPEAVTKKAVAKFRGTKRRMELIKKTKINGHSCVLVDDYGHHPTEIAVTVKAVKEKYPDKVLWTVFQPHTFSRTKALFDDFTKCFSGSDKTVILDIYTSAREKGGSVSAKDLVIAIDNPDVFYKRNITQAAKFLKQKINAPSVIMTIGASNVWELHKDV